MHIWLRDESRSTERRTPLVPGDARELIVQGARVTVERSEKRLFTDTDYAEAGCELAESGSWTSAPEDALILGVKELPDAPETLRGRFAHFAHLYKEQRGWEAQLARFRRGGATHYDLEYLTDETGRRVAAFGYWAGWLGAALGVWGWLAAQRNLTARVPFSGVSAQESQAAFVEPIRGFLRGQTPPRIVITGALGRAGRGAQALCESVGLRPTRWDRAEVMALDRRKLLDHDILVNCALITGPGTLFAMQGHLTLPGTRLTMISDVSCDPFSAFNPLPLYSEPTRWDAPFIVVARRRNGETVHLTAIDNLPSLLPREASRDFSAQLLPVLAGYPDTGPWHAAADAFRAACARIPGGSDM